MPRKKQAVIFELGIAKDRQQTYAEIDKHPQNDRTGSVSNLRDLLHNFRIIYPHMRPSKGEAGYICIDEKIVNKGGLYKFLPVAINYPDRIIESDPLFES